jgi:hypothetical protein
MVVMDEDLGKRWDVGHVDIPRLREGGTHASFFVLWAPVYFPGAEAIPGLWICATRCKLYSRPIRTRLSWRRCSLN